MNELQAWQCAWIVAAAAVWAIVLFGRRFP